MVGLAQAATEIYDANGRLRAVTNSTGASGRYVYDAMGNLLRVDNLPAGQLAIFAFSPSHGAPGVTVIVSGQGFSATPSNDAVAFNGSAATVTAATATQLTVTVPAGATTGSISVTVSGTTVTSDDSFVVDGTGLAPIITGVAPVPGIGGVGTLVTVTGTHLNPVPNQTIPLIGGGMGIPTSVTDTQVVFPVPATAGSGKVAIRTAYGVATSTSDFYVDAGYYGAANIAITRRLNLGTQTSISLARGKVAAIIFDATAGNHLSFQASAISPSANGLSYSVYDTHSQILIRQGWLSTSNASIHLPVIPLTGTYALWLSNSSAFGEPTVSMTLKLEANTMLTTAGAGTAYSTTAIGQSKRMVITALPGDSLSLALTGVSTSNGGNVAVGGYDASNNFIFSYTCVPGDCNAHLPSGALVSGGVYTVIASAPSGATMSFTAKLSAGATGTLQLNTPLTVNLVPPIPAATLHYTGSAGQFLELQVLNQSTTPAGGKVTYIVYDPRGATVARCDLDFTSGSVSFCNMLPLLYDGPYSVDVIPDGSATAASVQVQLVPGPAAVVTADGAVQTLSTTLPGQLVSLSFSALPGETLGLGLSDFAGFLTIYVPDATGYGLSWFTQCVTQYGCAFHYANDPGGTYRYFILSDNFTATLSHDLIGGTLTSTPTTVNITRHGQWASYTFQPNPNQWLDLDVTGVTTWPQFSYVDWWVLSPSENAENTLPIETFATDGFVWDLRYLTGPYRVEIGPPDGATLSAQLAIVNGVTGTLVINGSSQHFATTVTRMPVDLMFNAQAGDSLHLNLANSNAGSFFVYDANNNYIAGTGCSASTCVLNLPSLTGGAYLAVVYPPRDYVVTQSFDVTLTKP